MNRKSMVLASVVLVLVMGLMLPAVYAMEHGRRKEKMGCPMGEMKKEMCCPMMKGMMTGHMKEKMKEKGLDEKLFHKAHFILENKEELGLSDSQVEKIKGLKMSAKKDVIMKKAEIEVICIDIKAEMMKEDVDTKAINALIDKKYDIKKAKAKSLVEAYATLKGTLTKEQKAKLKDLYKKSEEKE